MEKRTTQRKDRDSKSATKKSQVEPSTAPVKEQEEQEVELSPKAISQRVFLYLRLFDALNLPRTPHALEMHLTHATHQFTKLETPYTTSNVIKLSNYKNNNPAVSTIIEQDSIDDLSKFSEYPLVVTLYERINPRHLKRYGWAEEYEAGVDEEAGEEEFGEEHIEALAQGTIDILPFFGRKRSISLIECRLYPIAQSQTMLFKTCTTTWQVYSLLPLIKNLNFCNLAFITFESIYNVSEELRSKIVDLQVDLSFQSKIPNENKEYEKIKICSFSVFDYQTIADQNDNQKWESIKDDDLKNQNSLAIQTGCKLNSYKRFKDLLWPEGVQIDFSAIDQETDKAMVCNSMRRFVLTDKLSKILENEIAFNHEHILLEFYNKEEPDLIILQGIVDLSLFLYPNVNACRIAVALIPPATKTANAKKPTPKRTAKGSRTSKDNQPALPKVTFAIISICVLTPITEVITPIKKYNNEILKALNLLCTEKMIPTNILPSTKFCELAYKDFDKLINQIINVMIENDVLTVDRAKTFFSCNLDNLINVVLRIIACDFNIRTHTKDNVEFSKLMTTVYKELEQRIYNILQGNLSLQNGYVTKDNQEAIIDFMSLVKYMNESENPEMAEFILEKVRTTYTNDKCLLCYIYINLIETQDFDAAQAYDKKPFALWLGEFHLKLTEIYTKYMLDLKNEETAPTAYENLLEMINKFISIFPLDVAGWVLLHCLYKRPSYLPGMTFTRWKFENLYGRERVEMELMPISRWDIYLKYELNPKSIRGIHFYSVVKLFLSLGLYKFAEIVYQQIQDECSEAERYIMTNTFKILQGQKEKKYSNKTYPGDLIKGYVAQVNGSMDHLYGNSAGSAKNYGRILEMKGIENYENYKLSLLRYAQDKLKEGDFNRAAQAFEKCCFPGQLNLLANVGMGKAMYRLNLLEEAEKCFGEATTYNMHIPDVWGFLALINLKMGKNHNALECWKYAKVDLNNIISDEILHELEKIDPNDVLLFVDPPGCLSAY